jgi:isopentenyldiphosphate isomerase/intracellular septation protein A
LNQLALLKQLLPGILPIFVYIIADEIWGTEIGLMVAIVFGLAEGVFTYLKQKKIDKFIVFDLILLSALGGISILLENDAFFKIKPALINFLILLFLGVSVFSSKNLMLGMSKRYMKGMEFGELQKHQMKVMLLPLFYVFLGYTLLSFYSVWYMDKAAWGFVNGVLLYIVFGIYFGFVFVWQKYLAPRCVEFLPVVDESGKILGRATRKQCHKYKLLHPVVHLHVFNKKKDIYLQKRPMHKAIQPGKWDTAVGGHIDFGEDIDTALKREAKEEIGLVGFKAVLMKNYVWESEVERELVYSFATFTDQMPTPDPKELDGGKFLPVDEIGNMKDELTPNFWKEFSMVKEFVKRVKIN